ncbi:MAG TPA: radical SAM protein [Chitinispirillaceae bacterium]|nr:radical SAM protein [Chitinispirillaceae bacterium]
MTNTSDSQIPQLRLVAWELTKSCVLSCRHCRASAGKKQHQNEFSTTECMYLIDSLASLGQCIIILTGGEPMLRNDIYQIARYGADKGLRMVLATCGTLLDKEKCRALRGAGIARISVSIDGSCSSSHDAFRGVQGAFDALMRAIEAANSSGLEFQVNTTITRSNIEELPDIFSLAVKLGAASFHPFLLVPTGRAEELVDQMISPSQYEQTLNWIYEKHLSSEISIKPTCAPHFYRIFREREKSSGRSVIRESHGFNAMTKGCLGGQGFAFISNIGKVQICGFLEKEAGDLRISGYDFRSIWENSPLFREIRAVDDYHGKCGYCEYKNACGGCRARAFAINGDYLGEETQCLYQPSKRNG